MRQYTGSKAESFVQKRKITVSVNDTVRLWLLPLCSTVGDMIMMMVLYGGCFAIMEHRAIVRANIIIVNNIRWRIFTPFLKNVNAILLYAYKISQTNTPIHTFGGCCVFISFFSASYFYTNVFRANFTRK